MEVLALSFLGLNTTMMGQALLAIIVGAVGLALKRVLGRKADDIHILVNGQMTDVKAQLKSAIGRIDFLEKKYNLPSTTPTATYKDGVK